MVGVVWADPAATSVAALLDLARTFSPRAEACGPGEVAIDLRGLARMFGDRRAMADELHRASAARGLDARVAVAGTRTAARLLARGAPEAVAVAAGDVAAALAPLPVALLAALGGEDAGPADELLAACRRWGLRTLGELAALPPRVLAARLGQAGVRWQRLARGEDARPLRPAADEERFEQTLELDWPIEGLEPLAFVLGRMIDPLAARLARRGRAAAVLGVRLRLVTRAVHARVLQLPAPIHDARTLRTLALLDLESHPAPAAIDRVTVALEPTPARALQFSLLTRARPSAEQVSTLLARLCALMGEDRCGTLAPADAWRPGAFTMGRFAPGEPAGAPWHVDVREAAGPAAPALALRRYRFPVPARVRVEAGRPVRVATDRRGLAGGRVDACAGPWRASGGWWDADRPLAAWDRDEWDVSLADGATYRVFRDRASGAWFVEGVVD